MAYLVLARKWRPGTFDAIIGQEHITRALRNAIKLDRVAHAFLFTGARGVGKTTAARVLAKALQCVDGPTEEPCGVCPACTEIATSSNIDVFEIDGASNRGIGEIRELRDGVAYAPQRDRFKIYIIDEVHMLTTEAFNALLKTLEEPPRHVKFIFATTEPQKIPVTILSRCQRYDFKRVPLGQVKTHLEALLKAEGVTIADDGLKMIARESEGSMRDSLSLLDRVISFAGIDASADAVAQCLGIADRKWIMELVRSLVKGKTAAALEVVAEVNQYGLDLRSFAEEVLHTLRDLVVVKIAGVEARAADLSDVEAKTLVKLGEDVHVVAMQRLFQVMLKGVDEMAESRHPRLVLEMAIVRATAALEFQGLPDVLGRLEAIEARLASGAPAPAQRAPAPSMTAASRPATAAPSAMPQRVAAAVTPQRAAPTGQPPHAGQADNSPGTGMTLEDWPAIIREVKQKEPLLATMMEATRVLRIEGPLLTLGTANKFYATQFASASTQDKLMIWLRPRLGASARVAIELASAEGTIAAERSSKRTAAESDRRTELEAHPVTQAAVRATQGRVVDLRIENPQQGEDE